MLKRWVCPTLHELRDHKGRQLNSNQRGLYIAFVVLGICLRAKKKGREYDVSATREKLEGMTSEELHSYLTYFKEGISLQKHAAIHPDYHTDFINLKIRMMLN